jgi:hypothetical protein
LIQPAGLFPPEFDCGRAIALAEHIDGEGVVAELGKHIGALMLIGVRAVPIMDDQDEALRGTFGRGAVAFKAFAADLIGDRLSGFRRKRRQEGKRCDNESSHTGLL